MYVLLGRRFLATLGSGLAFVLVHLLRDSVESRLLRVGSSLWAESALSVVAFVSVSSLGGLCPFVLGPLHVLVVYPPLSSALGRVECPLWRLSPLGSSPSLSLPWVCVPSSKGLSFLLFFPCCALSTFRVFLRSLVFLRVLLCCYVPVRVLLCYLFIFLYCQLFYYSWRRASGKFPLPPVILQLQFFRPH